MMQKFNLNFVFCVLKEKEHSDWEIAGSWLNICVGGLSSHQMRYNLNMFGNIIEKLSYRREMNRGGDWLDVKPGLHRAKLWHWQCWSPEINYIRTDKMTGTDLLEFLYFGQNCISIQLVLSTNTQGESKVSVPL